MLTTLFLIGFAITGWAQIEIDTSNTPEQLVNQILLGQGIKAGNITFTGPKNSLASFKFHKNLITGLGNGIILATGDARLIAEANNSSNATKGGYTGNKNRGDKDLSRIGRGRTFDAAVLEFDFVPISNKLSFEFCFGSEEYIEYVGSPFNDVFAFIINGPGLKRNTNLALVPGTQEIVSVNSINHKKNSNFLCGQ